GTVDKVLQEATAFKNETVAAARGEAERFTQVLSAYQEAPDVTIQRLYLDTMQDVLTNADMTIIDESLGGDAL
ncbi:MAG: protease modulator HflK, partial [Alphaproteobacteria bacterium]